jgi:probable HAF family extracellular repeat protein
MVKFALLHFAPKVMALAAATALAASIAQAQTRYTATPFPPFSKGEFLQLSAINASGAIVGNYMAFEPDVGLFGTYLPVGAFVFDGAELRDIVWSGNPGTITGHGITAHGINDLGHIVGSHIRQPGQPAHAYKMVDGVMLDMHPPDALLSEARAINATGDIAGYMYDLNDLFSEHSVVRPRAFAIIGGHVVRPLPPDSMDTSFGIAINALGEVAGNVWTTVGSYSFLWTGGTLRNLTPLVRDSGVNAINAGGDVVGYFFTEPSSGASYSRGYLATDGVASELPLNKEFASSASGINTAGHVVGGVGGRAYVIVDGRVHDLTRLVSGIDEALVTFASAINDAGQIAAEICEKDGHCFSARLDPIALPPVEAVEYYHRDFDHYFLTANATEVFGLDNGAPQGWIRTGHRFNVAPGPQVGTRPVCRFFSTSFGTKSSHFYTPSPEECARVRRGTDWQFEGIAFYTSTADVTGSCNGSDQPVYRLYNNGRGEAPNHRYTISAAVRDEMIAGGWIAEGKDSSTPAMCALQSSSDERIP